MIKHVLPFIKENVNHQLLSCTFYIWMKIAIKIYIVWVIAISITFDSVMEWRHFPRYWPFVISL